MEKLWIKIEGKDYLHIDIETLKDAARFKEAISGLAAGMLVCIDSDMNGIKGTDGLMNNLDLYEVVSDTEHKLYLKRLGFHIKNLNSTRYYTPEESLKINGDIEKQLNKPNANQTI